jgi:lycopene beta-cyclase
MSTRGTSIAIIGAGMAGQVLANKLSRSSRKADVHLIGPKDIRPQRISSWLTHDQIHAFEIQDYAQWQTWSLIGTHECLQHSNSMAYVSFDAAKYKTELEHSSRQQGLSRHHGVVTGIDEYAGEFAISTNAGTVLADCVIDTRPPLLTRGILKQQFVGHTLTYPDGHGVNHPILMDFNIQPSGLNGIEFMYILPISKTMLLVEATAFSLNVYSVEYFEQAIAEWLHSHGLQHYADSPNKEAGILPMHTFNDNNSKVIQCGMAANCARPSTGYAFLGIQRQTSALQRQFLAGKSLSAHNPFSLRSRWMDKIFLRVIKRNPNIGKQLFMRMAECLTGDEMANFLCDERGWRPCFKTVAAAPKLPFIYSALAD